MVFCNCKRFAQKNELLSLCRNFFAACQCSAEVPWRNALIGFTASTIPLNPAKSVGIDSFMCWLQPRICLTPVGHDQIPGNARNGGNGMRRHFLGYSRGECWCILTGKFHTTEVRSRRPSFAWILPCRLQKGPGHFGVVAKPSVSPLLIGSWRHSSPLTDTFQKGRRHQLYTNCDWLTHCHCDLPSHPIAMPSSHSQLDRCHFPSSDDDNLISFLKNVDQCPWVPLLLFTSTSSHSNCCRFHNPCARMSRNFNAK